MTDREDEDEDVDALFQMLEGRGGSPTSAGHDAHAPPVDDIGHAVSSVIQAGIQPVALKALPRELESPQSLPPEAAEDVRPETSASGGEDGGWVSMMEDADPYDRWRRNQSRQKRAAKSSAKPTASLFARKQASPSSRVEDYAWAPQVKDQWTRKRPANSQKRVYFRDETSTPATSPSPVAAPGGDGGSSRDGASSPAVLAQGSVRSGGSVASGDGQRRSNSPIKRKRSRFGLVGRWLSSRRKDSFTASR